MKLLSYLLILSFSYATNTFTNEPTYIKNWRWKNNRPKFHRFESSFESNEESIEDRSWDSNSESNSDSNNFSHSDSSESESSNIDSESYSDSDSDNYSDSSDYGHSFSLENSNEHKIGQRDNKGREITSLESNELKWHKGKEYKHSRLISKYERESRESGDWEDWNNRYDKEDKKWIKPKKIIGHRIKKSHNSLESDWSGVSNEANSPGPGIGNGLSNREERKAFPPWGMNSHWEWNEPKTQEGRLKLPIAWQNENKGLGWDAPGRNNLPWQSKGQGIELAENNIGWRRPNEKEWNGPRWHARELSIPRKLKENGWRHRNNENGWFGPKRGKWASWKQPVQNIWKGPKEHVWQYNPNDMNGSEDLSLPDESNEINWNELGLLQSKSPVQEQTDLRHVREELNPYESELKDQEKLSKKKPKSKKKKSKKSKKRKAKKESVDNEQDQPDKNPVDKEEFENSPNDVDTSPDLTKSGFLAEYDDGDDSNKGSYNNLFYGKKSIKDNVDNPSSDNLGKDVSVSDSNSPDFKPSADENIDNPNSDIINQEEPTSDIKSPNDKASGDNQNYNNEEPGAEDNNAENPYEIDNEESGGKEKDIKPRIPKVKIIIDDSQTNKTGNTNPELEKQDQSYSIDYKTNAA